MAEINTAAQETLFLNARSQNGWLDKPVDAALLHRLYDLAKMGPTAANCCPLRVVFLTTPAAIERLLPAMSPGNQDKTRTAPVVALLAYDRKFYDRIPELFPHNPGAREWFAGSAEVAEATAFRNGTLQAGYFIMAARAVGLDCGPMGGFDVAKVQDIFFAGTDWQVNFICGLGHGDASKVMERLPRLAFEDACRIETA